MDWNTIMQDIISSTISGVIVVIFGGIAGWIIYIFGIKGKEKDQMASERKTNIYIPLKYELDSIINSKKDIWQTLKSPEMCKIIDINDELVVDKHIFIQCEQLVDLISDYNSINLYSVVYDILCEQFKKKYIELYGSITHSMQYWNESINEEVEIEEFNQEFIDFQSYLDIDKNIENIFKRNLEDEEYYQAIGQVSPVNEYLLKLFSSALPKKQNTYKGMI